MFTNCPVSIKVAQGALYVRHFPRGPNVEIQQTTKVDVVVSRTMRFTWIWAGHLARLEAGPKQSPCGGQEKQFDDIVRHTGSHWINRIQREYYRKKERPMSSTGSKWTE